MQPKIFERGQKIFECGQKIFELADGTGIRKVDENEIKPYELK